MFQMWAGAAAGSQGPKKNGVQNIGRRSPLNDLVLLLALVRQCDRFDIGINFFHRGGQNQQFLHTQCVRLICFSGPTLRDYRTRSSGNLIKHNMNQNIRIANPRPIQTQALETYHETNHLDCQSKPNPSTVFGKPTPKPKAERSGPQGIWQNII